MYQLFRTACLWIKTTGSPNVNFCDSFFLGPPFPSIASHQTFQHPTRDLNIRCSVHYSSFPWLLIPSKNEKLSPLSKLSPHFYPPILSQYLCSPNKTLLKTSTEPFHVFPKIFASSTLLLRRLSEPRVCVLTHFHVMLLLMIRATLVMIGLMSQHRLLNSAPE